MRAIDRELDRMLTLLRNVIRRKGYTQLEVQDALGWGRSYISQLLTRQKSPRVDQILLVLKVINVEPAEFFGEIYSRGESHPGRQTASSETDDINEEIHRLGALFEGLVAVLKRKKVITANELAAAIQQRAGT